MNLTELTFDLEDENLFKISDLTLKAEAIKHSILPKLGGIVNHSVSVLSDLYEIDPLDFSTVVKFPAFRTLRSSELQVDYETAEAGLGGKRDKKLWKNVLTQKNSTPAIVPFSFTFRLSKEGMDIYFSSDRYNINLKNNEIFFDFFRKNESLVNILANNARLFLDQRYAIDNEKYFYEFIGLGKYLDCQIENKCFNLIYKSETIKYPITYNDIIELIERFTIFYPIYETCLELSSGLKISFENRTEKLRSTAFGILETGNSKSGNIYEHTHSQNFDLINSKIRIMPTIRWQVFQRDNWRCVSCGRGSHDGIILHVDHIVPRSKGGKNTLSNYQTLCHLCNIGKSNKNQTDLRNRR